MCGLSDERPVKPSGSDGTPDCLDELVQAGSVDGGVMLVGKTDSRTAKHCGKARLVQLVAMACDVLQRHSESEDDKAGSTLKLWVGRHGLVISLIRRVPESCTVIGGALTRIFKACPASSVIS